jgi:hypothetical protein
LVKSEKTESEQQSTKKKTMKTKTQIKTNTKNSKELQSRSEQVGTVNRAQDKAPRVLPFVDHEEREANRCLCTERVLELLRRWQPEQYNLAEVVGHWIWITFPEPPLEKVRAELSQLGFHWNNTRKCWQHPCGETRARGQQDPHAKYESYFPADQVAA